MIRCGRWVEVLRRHHSTQSLRITAAVCCNLSLAPPQAWRRYDTDRSGYIEANELKVNNTFLISPCVDTIKIDIVCTKNLPLTSG